MFAHSFKNTLKTLLRQRTLVFWGLVFPIVLGFFFKLALGNIDAEIQFEVIPVAVNEKLLEDEIFSGVMSDLEEEDILEITATTDDSLVKDKEVVAYIEDLDKIITSGSGIQETIVESIMNAYSHNQATIIRIMTENPQADLTKILEVESYIEDTSSSNMSMVNTYFYTLIGMQAMYGYMWGLTVMYQYEANLSTEAKRNVVAPIKKYVSLFAALLVAWLINMVVIIILMLVVHFVLNVNLGDQIGPILGLVSLAALTGVGFGTLIGVSNKRSMDLKVGIGISLTMAMSFLAGMMVMQMKIIIQRVAPIVNQINPVALITDAMYSLYYYPTLDRYFTNMIWLAGVTIVFIGATFFFIRGKRYDSL
ncbi:MAG TPA: ABC transporter permease [Erysipelothrix sp.]|nr:ABC transporter permease [Erysipelothrix sp.]